MIRCEFTLNQHASTARRRSDTKISLKRAPPPILSRRRHHVRPHNSCPKPLQLNVRASSLTKRNEDYGASRKEEG